MDILKNIKIEGDISGIVCRLNKCKVSFFVEEGKAITMDADKAFKFKVCQEGKKIIVRQGARKILDTFRRTKHTLKIGVPAHIVPSLSLTGTDIDLDIEHGIYRDFDIYSDKSTIQINDAAFEGIDVRSIHSTANICSATVKNSLYIGIGGGEILLEKCFALHTECRNKGGNVGAIDLNSRNNIFEAENGNITATIYGEPEQFNISIEAKEGTCNRQSSTIENCPRFIKAYTQNGNILLDFVKKEEA
jgi:hypothetical protein